jgi:hypothetical protein
VEEAATGLAGLNIRNEEWGQKFIMLLAILQFTQIHVMSSFMVPSNPAISSGFEHKIIFPSQKT